MYKIRYYIARLLIYINVSLECLVYYITYKAMSSCKHKNSSLWTKVFTYSISVQNFFYDCEQLISSGLEDNKPMDLKILQGFLFSKYNSRNYK